MQRQKPPTELPRLIERVRAEYIEMPGLRLTYPQARRLWGVDERGCQAVVNALVKAQFLTETRDGALVRR